MEKKKAETIRSWEIVFPNDANPQQTMFGGKLMATMDKIAGIAASRYSKRIAVTASTEAMDFINPVQVGDRIQTSAKVVWVGNQGKIDIFAALLIIKISLLYAFSSIFSAYKYKKQ